MKTWGKVLLGRQGMSKIVYILFLTGKCNLKISRNDAVYNSFERKFNKYSGER